MSLSEFLLARVAEDEGTARAATRGEWTAVGTHFPDEDSHTSEMLRGYIDVFDNRQGLAEGQSVTDEIQGWDAYHIARHDPARVLAECDAKRRIVERCRQARADQGIFGEDGQEPLAEDILRLLAQPYSGHPDYKPEWYMRRHEKDAS